MRRLLISLLGGCSRGRSRHARRGRRCTRAVGISGATATAVAVCAAAPTASRPSPPQDHPTAAATPGTRRGPASTDQDFYFVMGDRFENGDPANDQGGLTGDRNATGFDATAKGFYNGGDLDGLRSRLDYIQGLGTDAIWLTPVFKNKPVQIEDGPSAGYHGYWITDFTQVDPHLGTNQDLADLVDAAHDRGMKVFFDIITNHTADVIGYSEGARTGYVSKDVKPYLDAAGNPFDDRDFAGSEHLPRRSTRRRRSPTTPCSTRRSRTSSRRPGSTT